MRGEKSTDPFSFTEEQSQSPIAQCWILRPQKCQNFHVVTQRERQTDTGWISGACVWSIPPEKDGPHAVFYFPFFTLWAYQHQSEEKPVNQRQYTYWITTPQVDISRLQSWQKNERIAKFCIVSSQMKKGRGKTNVQIRVCAHKVCVCTSCIHTLSASMCRPVLYL